MKHQLLSMVRDFQSNMAGQYSHLPTAAQSEAQADLMAKHGSPYDFAMACVKATGDFISVDEAEAGIQKYLKEWEEAK